jgi:uncharacterized membrane protein
MTAAVGSQLLASGWALTVSRLLVSVVFVVIGAMEALWDPAPMSEWLPWIVDHPLWFTRIIGLIDILGGTAILVPWAFNILPQAVKIAAVGCASKQLVAFVFHAYRLDMTFMAINVALFVMSVVIIRAYSVRVGASFLMRRRCLR